MIAVAVGAALAGCCSDALWGNETGVFGSDVVQPGSTVDADFVLECSGQFGPVVAVVVAVGADRLLFLFDHFVVSPWPVVYPG